MDLPILTQKQQAHIFATGLLALLILGSLSLAALVFVATWAVCALASLIVTSLIEALGTIGATYQSADPLIRLLVLVALGYAVYRLVARLRRSRSH